MLPASTIQPSGISMGWLEVRLHAPCRMNVMLNLLPGPGSGPDGYSEGVLRPDLLIVEGGRSEIVNPKRRDREKALLGM